MEPEPKPRTRDAAQTRDRILTAATARFTVDGYDKAGLREICAEAGADPALVCRYFGSKEQLFAQVLASTGSDPMRILAGDRAGFGLRVARALLQPDDASARDSMAFIALAFRSAASPVGSRLVRRRLEERFTEPFTAWLGGEQAVQRAHLIASVLMGVTAMRGVLFVSDALEAQEDLDSMIGRLARVLQAIIDEPDDPPVGA